MKKTGKQIFSWLVKLFGAFFGMNLLVSCYGVVSTEYYVHGTVTYNNEPIENVNVQVREDDFLLSNTTTDSNGKYSISIDTTQQCLNLQVKDSNKIYQTWEQTISFQNNSSRNIDISLEKKE